MDGGKYHAHTLNRDLDPASDGCAMDQWRANPGRAAFAVHPKGFFVFLPFDRIAAMDEYRGDDPYALERDIGSGFHQNRIACTLELVQDALVERARALEDGASAGPPRVLDLGCGRGYITALVRDRFPQAEISALDVSLSAIEAAAGRFPGIDFIVADAFDPPYRAGYFDLVICNNLWEHVPNPLHLLTKISRVLAPGGYVVISTPSRYRLGNIVRVLTGRAVNLISKLHVTEYSVGQVKEQLRHGGFDVVRVLSRRMRGGSPVRALVIFGIGGFLKLIGSHHSLEGTVFFLARKTRSR
jgi:SAM-dependent methyltransferase